jgi:hypothetical protein
MNSSFTPNRTSAWKFAVVCEGRVVELRVDQVHVPVDEDLLPGHDDVVEDDGGVDLVEAGRERVVEDARRL